MTPTKAPKAPKGAAAPATDTAPAGSVKGTITLGRMTAGHEEWLRKRGYSVEKSADGTHLIVSGSEVVDTLDLGETDDDAVKVLKDLIERKGLLTYRSEVTIGGKVYKGFPLVGKLGAASALVVMTAKGRKLNLSSL